MQSLTAKYKKRCVHAIDGDAPKPPAPEGMTMPERALRFILGNPAISTIMAGMRRLRRVEANLAVSEAGPLPTDLHKEVRQHRWDRQPTEWSQ